MPVVAPPKPQKQPKPPIVWTRTKIAVAAVAGALFLVGFLYMGFNGGFESSPPAPPTPVTTPCDDAVLNAPYETGSKYDNRDQGAERTKACMDYQLDHDGR